MAIPISRPVTECADFPSAAGTRGPSRRRHRWFPWVTMGLVTAGYVLTSRDQVGIVTVLAVAIGIKVLAGAHVAAACGAYRRARRRGERFWTASGYALEWIVPRWAAWLTILQARCLIDLTRWFTHRRNPIGGFAVHQDSLVRLFVWSNLAPLPIEFGLVELLLHLANAPWWWHLLDVAIHGLAVAICLGVPASLVIRPHQLTEHGLLLRGALLGEVTIAYHDIARVRLRHRPADLVAECGYFRITSARRRLVLGIGSTLNITITLRRPVTIDPYHRGTPRGPIQEIDLRLDSPDEFATALNRHVDLPVVGVSNALARA